MMENTPEQNMPNEHENAHKKMSAKKVYAIILLSIFAFCCVCAISQLTNSVSATVMINSFLSADGKNLLAPGKDMPNNKLFLLMICAVLKGVDTYPVYVVKGYTV